MGSRLSWTLSSTTPPRAMRTAPFSPSEASITALTTCLRLRHSCSTFFLLPYIIFLLFQSYLNSKLFLLLETYITIYAWPWLHQILSYHSQGEFYNYSGCGNTFNCNHPVVRQFIVDCLRFSSNYLFFLFFLFFQ